MIELKDEMPDYIDKIVKEKLPPNTPRCSIYPPPKLEQNGVGVTDTPTKITRDMFLELKRTQALLKLVRA